MIIEPEVKVVEENRGFRDLSGIWKNLIIILTIIALFLVINQVFLLKFFVNFTIMENSYLYLLITLFLSFSYLIYPINKKAPAKKGVPWYDIVLFFLTVVISVYLAFQGMNIVLFAWEYNAPVFITGLGILLWVLILEALRRCGGYVLLIVVGFFSLYPLFASVMPTWFSGQEYSFIETARFHIFSTQSVLGLPMKVFSMEIIGYIVFGVALQVTGGGKFFMDISLALVGKTRGGPAKVSVLSSGLFGSISGSVISNVITTGSMTIPTMKKSGYRPETAGAIEACASTGGVLTPPVMGATAFLIASFLQVPYVEVAIAATVPAVLYYASLLFQADLYAARRGIKGLEQDKTTTVMKILFDGWVYVASMVILVYLLGFMGLETWSPYFATLFLVVATMFIKSKRMSLGEIRDFIYSTGLTLTELFVILAGIGMIIGSLSMTGMAQAFSRELTSLAGNNVYLLLLYGALTSFILGMGMTVSAAYIFLAVVLIPSLVQLGINPMAAHLFVLYWSMLSNITPPVALGAFTAASIAGSNPMKTGFESMKIGAIIYFIPFFFVLNPGLILQDFVFSSFLILLITSVFGIVLITSGLQGYIYFIGSIPNTFIGGASRFLISISGLLLMVPGAFTDILGLILSIAVIIVIYLVKKVKPEPVLNEQNLKV